jgi:peptide deformylase
MNKLELVLYPNPILLEKCEPVDKVTSELQQLAKDMYEFMVQNNGIGLSANQVNHKIRLIVIQNEGTPLHMFNPKILQQISKCSLSEGCLSFPNEYYEIKRAKEIKVQYRDINNKVKFGHFTGWVARAILHEIDHLNGEVFINKVEKDESN